MPRRRRPVHAHSKTRTREQIRRSSSMFRHAIEELESRVLFDTISGSGVFEYKDAENQIVRVRFHNVTAELVFARVDEDTNNVVLGNRTAPFLEEDGKDLFHIYVAEAGADSFITVAEVPALNANTRPMQAFQGSVGLTIFGREGITGVSTAGGSGSIYLGARTKDTPANIADEADRPILTDNFNGLGILGPRPNGRLTAGILVETGQDLGRFFWGGAISGEVYFGGSVDTFYCGALLTGDTRGQTTGTPSIVENFVVEGDVRELIVRGSIGTDGDSQGGEPDYQTGFDARVGGTIGRVQSYGSILGNIKALNDPIAPRLRGHQREVENRVQPGNRGSLTHFEGNDTRDLGLFDPDEVGQPRLGDNVGDFDNDTFDTPQLLGAFDSKRLGNNVIDLDGRLQNTPQIGDEVDYYGLGMLAGQTVTVKLTSGLQDFFDDELFVGEAILTIEDPDGRLVASDIVFSGETSVAFNQQFQFTADRPGTYRFVVTSNALLANIDYNLQITNVGELTIGAVAAEGDIYNDNFSFFQGEQFSTVAALRGDVGVVFAGDTLAFDTIGQPFALGDIFIDSGNLRSVDANQLGFIVDNVISSGVNFSVIAGNVGMIRARGGLNHINSLFVTDNNRGIGGNIQLIDATTGNLHINVDAEGGVGVIRGASMALDNAASVINVNTDRKGSDGIIDLISVSGDLGTLSAGGPAITTGPGGNVRYMHVGGQAFRDRFFGGGEPDIATFEAGERVHIVDDSGTQMILDPIPASAIPIPGQPAPGPAGALTVVRYGIRDKGGVVLIRVDSTRGLRVASFGQSRQGTAEISEINALGPGSVIVDDPGFTANNPLDDRLEVDTGGTNEILDVILEGNALTDVYELNGGNFTRIINETGGEIVTGAIGSVGEFFAGTIGLARSHTDTLIGGQEVLNIPIASVDPDPDAGPFQLQRTAIRIGGDAVSISASQGIGNVVVSGTIQELIPNADGVNTKGVHEGINAPIMTQPGGVVVGGGGGIRLIGIGEGLLESGSGEVQRSGIFAHGRIGTIFNQGAGSDIRGSIASKGANLPTITTTLPNGTIRTQSASPIGTIALTNGSIIGSTIGVVSTFQGVRDFNAGPITTPDVGTTTTPAVYEIETIGLTGNGGIIGSIIFATDVGDVVVSGGFGIINTFFSSTAQAELRSIVADGFGIRSCFYAGGGSLNAVIANGKGNRLATTDFSGSVRWSETRQFDPFTGQLLTGANDLHKYLGTTKDAPVRTTTGMSKSGVIDLFTASGARDLGVVQAYQIKNTALNFATSTNQIHARDSLDGLIVTSGRLNSVFTGGDVHRSQFNIAGPVGSVDIGGTFRGTSSISATGPNGQISTVNVRRSLWGAVISSNNVAQIRVGGDYGASGALNEAGETISAGIDVGGNLQSFIVGGSVLSGSTVFVDDNLGLLDVGGDIQDEALIDVETLGVEQIDGSIFGDLIIRSEE